MTRALLLCLLLAAPQKEVHLKVGGFTNVRVDDLERVEVENPDVVEAVRVGSNVLEMAGSKEGHAKVIALTRSGGRFVFAVTVGQAAPLPPPKPRISAKLAKQTRTLREQAQAAHKAGHPDQAVPLLQKALTLDPDDAQAHRLLGSALLATDKQDEAAREYRRFLQLAPDDPEAPAIRRALVPFEKSR